ncbi:amidase family protein, partial [Latilactobacillus sakei subsp. carnosus]
MSATFPWRNRGLASHLESLQERIEQADNSIFIDVFDLESLPSHEGELSGALVSIKSTFDVLGYPTTGGTKILNQGIAQANAEVVTRLISAGAKLVGHTNMTELAYSGLGLNPHYGTPDNPLLPGRIPGGSTSGGAVSVALNLADIALGTDTGGSLRIPAAFCGLTGFKPTQDSVSRQGCLPLSNELDSVGPIARDVATCRQAWEVLSGKQADETQDPIYLVVPTNFGF